MTERQIEYMCDLGCDNSYRKKMLDIAAMETGLGQFVTVGKDGSISGIPRAVLHDTCIAMAGDTCFYIDGEKGLSNLVLPFENKTRDTVTKEERKAAIAYAESHGIKMPANFRCLFYEWPELIPYMSPCRNEFPSKKESEYFASVLADAIKSHKDAFLKGIPLSEKDFCDSIIYGYNRRVLNNLAFSENIRSFPKGSPVRRLVTYAFCSVGNAEAGRPKEIWMKENVTPSMDEEDFGLFKAITSIKKPKYERAVGNKKRRTFDTIRVWFSLVSRDIMPERNAFIKENRKGFMRLALACIQDDRRYEVPVNLLKIDHIGITSQSQLEFIFSLKDEVITAFQQ